MVKKEKCDVSCNINIGVSRDYRYREACIAKVLNHEVPRVTQPLI